MYKVEGKLATKIEPTTLKALKMKEEDLEELLRNNINMVCAEEESMLIVGQNGQEELIGLSTLTAIDNEGNLVLIELKKEQKEEKGKEESFEFRALRNAANYAAIKSVEELVSKFYAPYLETYREEYEVLEVSTYEYGQRKINEFLTSNNAQHNFNRKQKIILVGEDFTDETRKVVTWLNNSGLAIDKYKLTPYNLDDHIYISAIRAGLDEELIDYVEETPQEMTCKQEKSPKTTRRNLPRIDTMLKWGIVNEGDIIQAKGKDELAVLLANGNVLVGEKEMTMALWLKGVFGWSNIQTYAFALHQESGKTLGEMREEYLAKGEQGNLNSTNKAMLSLF